MPMPKSWRETRKKRVYGLEFIPQYYKRQKKIAKIKKKLCLNEFLCKKRYPCFITRVHYLSFEINYI